MLQRNVLIKRTTTIAMNRTDIFRWNNYFQVLNKDFDEKAWVEY